MMRNLELKIWAVDSQQWECDEESEDVLPYYQWAYEILNPGQTYISGYNYQNDVREKQCMVLRTMCPKEAPDYYYDLRNWDDFSCAAPQYLTLNALGWNRTTPMAFHVRGCDDLPLVLEIFDAMAHPGETVAITVVERIGTQYRLVGMFIEKCSKKTNSSDG